MIVFFLLISVALGTALWLVLEPSMIRRRRRRLLAEPSSEAWPAWIAAHVPLYERLPVPLRERLLGLTRLFLDEKRFVGCNGLELTDEMRVVIAFQASLLVANRPGVPLASFYDELASILVYPTAFLVEDTRHATSGVVTTHRAALSGQAWEAQRIILSWDDIEHPEGAGNVVLHEFAHYLDMENDSMDGAPALPSTPAYARWSEAFWAEYRRLQDDLLAGRPSLLDAYAATEPAEFFAVATEVFFERPEPLKAQHPGLYEQLQRYYGLDPAAWSPPELALNPA